MTFADLSFASTEKEVEHMYWTLFTGEIKDIEITSQFNTDGFLVWKHNDTERRVLLECKVDRELTRKHERAAIIAQLICYTRKFLDKGIDIPNIFMIGDKNECVIVESKHFQYLLDMEFDWNMPPSSCDNRIVYTIEQQKDYPYMLFRNSDLPNFRSIIDCINSIAIEQQRVKVGEKNIESLYNFWCTNVMNDKKITEVDKLDCMFACLFHPERAHVNPAKGNGNLLIYGGRYDIKIKGNQFDNFINKYDTSSLTIEDIDHLYETRDRLIQDRIRRLQGAFYTPRIWVDVAYDLIGKTLGSDWRKTCVVWDPAAGTGNLTRDYSFDNLILSTFEQADVESIKRNNYNEGAVVEQFDFLNGDIDGMFPTLPSSIVKRLMYAVSSGKHVVFLMNPPYGTANDAGAKGSSKAGIATTVASSEMKSENIGAASQQLYAQFMFRVSRIVKMFGIRHYTLVLYSVPTFMTSSSYKGFREFFYKKFKFVSGALFNAAHFAGVSDRWGVSLTLWQNGTTTGDIKLDVLDINNSQVVKIDTKTMYCSDNQEASQWVRQEVKGLKTFDAPQLTSGLEIKQHGDLRGSCVDGSLGYLTTPGNGFQWSATGVWLSSSPGSNGHGLSIIPQNFKKVCALFAVRKLVSETWINQKDEYLAPLPQTERTTRYQQWNDDCVIYSLFHSSSQQTSMRDVSYKGKNWTIRNDFFWRKNLDMRMMANVAHYTDMYHDTINNSEESYLATIYDQLNLSPEAVSVMRFANMLLECSMARREAFNYEYTEKELHLNAWDAGAYQLKELWKQYPEWKEFKDAYKVLEDKLQPLVYDFGFLK